MRAQRMRVQMDRYRVWFADGSALIVEQYASRGLFDPDGWVRARKESDGIAVIIPPHQIKYVERMEDN